MPLFEIAILQKPTKKEAEEGATEKLIFGPKSVIARDEQAAGFAALMGSEVPRDLDMNRAEVLIRPFA
jgi:hypothetical protein